MIIVASGRFAETVFITGPEVTGHVTLEAAPGVEANIDAVLQGDPLGGNAGRQGDPGIIIAAPNTVRIVLRNLVFRNWREGIRILGGASVTIDNCRLENNRDFGINVIDGRAAISKTHVNATGFRVSAGVDNTPNPGIGIGVHSIASASIFLSSVTGSFAAGISGNATVDHVQTFDNNPNLQLNAARKRN